MIGPRIRRIAAERDLTMLQVADRAGITRSNLYRILAGQEPRYNTIEKLANGLGVKPFELLGGESTKMSERLDLLASVCRELKDDSLLRVIWYARYERDAA